MKKFFLLASLVCGFGMVAANAQSLFQKHERVLTLPQGYVCYRTAVPIKIDGKLKEKSWDMALPTASFVDISGEGFAKPIYDTRAKMLWDDDYLYVSAVLEEPNIVANLTQRDTIIYHDNDFEVFIDPDGDGHHYFEIENNAREVIFDLMLDRPYRCGGNFMIQWDCPGIKLAVDMDGTMNKPKDKDKQWTVEMAIPRKALTINFTNLLKAGNYWRINFSRVQWLKKGGPEENWVWQPTGKIDMHMPDRWGFLYFSSKTVGQGTEEFKYPYNMAAYKLLWAMFYEQHAFHAKENNYIRTVENFFLTDAEYKGLPENAEIQVEATANTYRMSIALPSEGVRYVLNQEGRFNVEKIAPRTVMNWMWMRIKADKSSADYLKEFKLMKDCGIGGVMFEGYDERVYKLCKEAGLEAHYWKWTMNRGEAEFIFIACNYQHVAQARFQCSLTFTIGVFARNSKEFCVVVNFEFDIGIYDWTSFLVGDSDGGVGTLCIIVNDVDFCIVGCLLHNVLRTVVCSENLCMHQHTTACRGVEPT